MKMQEQVKEKRPLAKKQGRQQLFLRFGGSKAAFCFKLQTAKHLIKAIGAI
jgi:hypothetical protein